MGWSFFPFISAAEPGAGPRLLRRFLPEGSAPEDFRLWAVGIGLILAVLLLALLVARLARRRPSFISDWVTDPQEIRAVLERALDQRSKFELRFSPGQGGRRPALRCIAARVEDSFLILEAIGLKTLSNRWIGREMECFFQIAHKGNALHHAFHSFLAGVQTVNNCCFIRIGIPDRLEARQKRSHLRMAPPEEYILGAAVWYGPHLPPPASHENLNSWPRPSLAYLPAVARQVVIRDLSANGARLHIPKDCLTASAPHVTAMARVMFMLDLWDPDESRRLRCWILCRVQSPVLDFETQGMDLGLQFLSWARARETGDSGALEWLRLSRSGEIDVLGTWIMRRHLELFREPENNAGPTFGAAPRSFER